MIGNRTLTTELKFQFMCVLYLYFKEVNMIDIDKNLEIEFKQFVFRNV